jgi:superfamily II DNA or RNA helicase
MLNTYNDYVVRLNKGTLKVMTADKVISNKLQDECTLLILDEVHKFTTSARFGIVEGRYIKYTNGILGLTATYPGGEKGDALSKYLPVIDKISYKEAFENKWVSGITEYNLSLSLSKLDKMRYVKFSKHISETISLFRMLHLYFKNGNRLLFKNDYELIMACFRGHQVYKPDGTRIWIKSKVFRDNVAALKGWHSKLDLSDASNYDLDLIWNPTYLEIRIKQFKDFIDKRNQLLFNNDIKLNTVLQILKKETRTTLCFNHSVEFAEKITFMLNKNIYMDGILEIAQTYHSSIPSKIKINHETGDYYRNVSGKKKGLPKVIGTRVLKRLILEDLDAGRCKIISTVQSLREGISIPKLQQIITTSGDTNPVTYMQTIGRGMTINPEDSDKKVNIINLYFDDFVYDDKLVFSRDKQKLIARQAKNEDLIKWVSNIDEII